MRILVLVAATTGAAGGDLGDLGLAVLLLAVALLLAVLEIFLVSGGLLGIGACVALVFSIHFAFAWHLGLGWAFIAGTPLLAWATIRWGLRRLRHSSLVVQGTAGGSDSHSHYGRGTLDVGSLGTLLTPAYPSGRARFENGVFDVQIQGGSADAGTTIQIIDIRGPRILATVTSSPTP